jgi:hypothetical protein
MLREDIVVVRIRIKFYQPTSVAMPPPSIMPHL